MVYGRLPDTDIVHISQKKLLSSEALWSLLNEPELKKKTKGGRKTGINIKHFMSTKVLKSFLAKKKKSL